MKEINEIVKKAGKLYEEQNYTKASEILTEYINLNSDSEACNLLAMINFATNKTEEAIKNLNIAIELEPKNTTFLNNLAIAYLNIDKSKALEYFERVLEIEPNSFETYKTLGSLYFQNGRVKEAFSCYEKLLRENKMDFDIAFNYARLLYDIGDAGNSVQYINQALNFNKNDPRVHLQAGDVFFKMSCPNEATMYYKDFLSLTNSEMDNYIFSKIQKGWAEYSDKFYRFNKIKEKSYREFYNKAISKSVKDKVVLEYGRNGGLFAMMAASAGAKKVYIYEKDKYIATQIEEVIKSNGFEDKIEVVKKNIYQIENLKVDIAIIDKFGNFLVDENILMDLKYIKSDILNDNGKFIPESASLNGITIESEKLKKDEFEFNMKGFSVYETPYIETDLNELTHSKTSNKFKIFDFDFYNPVLLNTATIKPNFLSPNSNGVAIWFELNFGDEKVETISEKNSYFKQLIWLATIDENSTLEFIQNRDNLFVNTFNN